MTIRSDRKAGLESPRGIGHGEPDDEAVRSNGNAQENGGEAGEKPGSKGQLAMEDPVKSWSVTQSQAKRINEIQLLLFLRNHGSFPRFQ